MSWTTRVATVGFAATLPACATLPDVTMNYYLAHSSASFKVVRTVTCDAADNPIVATSVAPAVQHSADRSKPHELQLASLRGPLSDADVKIEFYEDGRLKTLNATVTGQGEAILKGAISLLSTFSSLEAASNFADECKFIKDAGGGKPLTLTYFDEVTLDSDRPQEIKPDAASGVYAQQLSKAIGTVCARVESRSAPQAPASTSEQKGDTLITLRQPGTVELVVYAGTPNCAANVVWKGTVLAGQHGVTYQLPIPPPAMFGKQVFGVAIAESGALQSAQYVANTGAAQALGVVNVGLTTMQGDSAAQVAARVKAEADLIAQQQRLVRCRADPTACS